MPCGRPRSRPWSAAGRRGPPRGRCSRGAAGGPSAGRYSPAGRFYGLQLALLAVTGTGAWNSAAYEPDAAGTGIAAIHAGSPVLGAGPQGIPFFVLNLLLSLTVSSVLTGVLFAVGEEIGWRAVLQPELSRRFGPLKGTLLVAALWAYWHLPVNLAGYNDPAHPVANALLLFPLGILGVSFMLAWITQRSGSVWPAAVAHGAGNALAAKLVLTPSSWEVEQVTRGVAALVVAALFAWLAWRDHRRGQAQAPDGASVAARAAVAPGSGPGQGSQ